ncbi:MAG: DUF2497 domain-containing protein [Rhodospirillaceae bacterium]|nr:DUF2497 domain-containing protein [Rhodospirillaceae bacterium]
MTSQKPSTDLSKQQILESIGRIVAEGEGRAPSPDDDASPEAAPKPAAAAGEDEDEDDILDLVDMVDERGNVIHLDRAREGAPPASTPPGAVVGGPASSEQVLETLRPMLQTWIDTHMPPMVERMVKRELERASDRSEPE